MTRIFIKDEEHYAEWYRMVKHAIAKSKVPRADWVAYRNSGLEAKYKKGVVILSTGARQQVITATLEELKTFNDLPALAKQRTKDAINTLTFIRSPANDDSRETKRPRPRPPMRKPVRKRKRQLVIG